MTAAGEEESGDNASKNAVRIGIRHFLALLMFLGMTLGYTLRVGLSVAIVPMVNSSTANPEIREYGWSDEEKSTILSSFFWGYTIMQIPSGYIANVWSAHKLLSIGMFLCGTLNRLTPWAADLGGVVAVCVCRVGMGLCQGCLLPCVHTLLSKWVPPSERARLGAFVYAGAQFGTVVAFPISGALAEASLGWPYIFYVFGEVSALWGMLFFLLGGDSPHEYKKMSEKEKEYIEAGLRASNESEPPDSKTKQPIPWKSILTSLPMWSLIIAHCGQNWGYWILLTEMPSYLNGVLGFKVEKSGYISALPYLAMWILSFPVSWLSDYALNKGVSRAVTRKVCNTIAHWGPAVALICLGFTPADDTTPAIVILIVAVGLNAGSLCGFQINHIDLSPNYAGTMMAITNCSASIVAILAPLIHGQIVHNVSDASEWAIIFYLSAAIYFIGNLIFIIFGEAEVQWWNDAKAVAVKQEKEDYELT